MNDENNKVSLKAVRDLGGMKFFVPRYQRGYRWGKREVNALLDDIDNFDDEVENNLNQDLNFYCLQPLVVAKEPVDGKDQWRVIDGQQRLTTIYLILQYIRNKDSDCDTVDYNKVKFDIEYETRNKSGKFLENIRLGLSDDEANKNSDFYHMFEAYKNIVEWMKEKKGVSRISDRLFSQKKNKIAKFIWNEVKKDNEIDTFINLNVGKIPLLQSELIKALILNTKNFINKPNLQVEIAKEWDDIEYFLRKKDFWNFLTTESSDKYPVRINLLFEIYAKVKSVNANENRYDGKSQNLFSWFEQECKQVTTPSDLWNKGESIKQLFLILRSWFEDDYLFHYIGFLVMANNKIENIYRELKNKNKKEKFIWLHDKILEILGIKDEKAIKSYLEKLDYYESPKLIHNILLFFNIYTMLHSNESVKTRFNFSAFNPADKKYKDKWSLEHICPQNSEGAKLEDDFWANTYDCLKEMDKTELIEALTSIGDDTERIEKLYKEFNTSINIDNIDGISNLALLRHGDNSSLSNDIFPVKRKKIIELDKQASFIPVCTKNVFLKYYSKNNKNIFEWQQDDASFYLDDIVRVLSNFQENIKQNNEG